MRCDARRAACAWADTRHAPQLELAQHPQLEKHWRYLQKKEAKAAKLPGHVPTTQTPAVTFLPGLVQEFLDTLQSVAPPGGDVDAPQLTYCEARARCCCVHSSVPPFLPS